MWRSCLSRLAARRPLQHYRQFKMRRNPSDVPAGAADQSSIPFQPNVARNLAFAAGSSCFFFTAGAVFMYEKDDEYDDDDGDKHRPGQQQQTPHQKWASQGPWMRAWDRLSPAQKQFNTIFGVNAVIFAMWKLPHLAPFLTRHFARSPMSNRVTPMLLSVFSHNSIIQLSLNMFTLYIFIGPATAIMGNEQFLVTYLTAGVVSSVASHFVKCFRKIPTISMGAGGAVLSMMGIVSLAAPEGQLHFSILPLLFPPFICSISYTLEAFILVDIIGFALKWTLFDHTARLAGVLFSLAYFRVGYKLHQWYTDRFIDIWDRFRSGTEDP